MTTEDISHQILTQTSENIQKLFELSTRIDERVKHIYQSNDDLKNEIQAVSMNHHKFMERLAILETKANSKDVEDLKEDVEGLDRRLMKIEHVTTGAENRWRTFGGFVLQLVWVVLAAWLLFKLNLQPLP
jgi:hypothetical protein